MLWPLFLLWLFFVVINFVVAIIYVAAIIFIVAVSFVAAIIFIVAIIFLWLLFFCGYYLNHYALMTVFMCPNSLEKSDWEWVMVLFLFPEMQLSGKIESKVPVRLI